MGTAGRVVGFSGVAVATGLSGLLFFDGSYLFAMGIGGIDRRRARRRLRAHLPAGAARRPRPPHRRGPPPATRPRGAGLWHRTAVRVMRARSSFSCPTLGLLLFMGLPFLHLRLAAADVRVLPDEAEARRGYELLRAHFPGPGGQPDRGGGALPVVAHDARDADGASARSRRAWRRFRRYAGRRPDQRSRRSPWATTRSSSTRSPTRPPRARRPRAIVRALRADRAVGATDRCSSEARRPTTSTRRTTCSRARRRPSRSSSARPCSSSSCSSGRWCSRSRRSS